MNDFARDLRYAVRTYCRSPGYTLTAILALTLGVGVAIPVLSLAHGGITREAVYANPPAVAGVETTGGFTAWTDDAVAPARVQTENLEALLSTMLVVTLFVLAVAAVNVAILLLARATARRREVAVRAVLGAGRGRLVRQLLTEGALLAAVGGGLGLALGLSGLHLLRATWPAGLTLWLGVAPPARATVIALAIPLGAALLFGLTPALAVSHRSVRGVLAGGMRATASPGEGWVRNTLMVAATAATVVLLTSAGLLLRGAAPAEGEAVQGYVPQYKLAALVAFPESRQVGPRELLAGYRALLERVASLPGVEAESIASPGTLVGLGVIDNDLVQCGECYRGNLYLPVFSERVRHHVIGPAFFDTIGIPVLRGREFTRQDRIGAPRVAVVNESYVQQVFRRHGSDDINPIGKGVQLGGVAGAWYEIVGVVANIRPRGIGSGSRAVPTVYLSAFQHPPRAARLVARTAADNPMTLATAVHEAISEPAAGPIVAGVTTVEKLLARFVAPLEWFARIFGALAALAVLLSAVALYGVTSYNVRRRTREIGIRMALGARPWAVVRGVVGRSVRLTALGAGIGFLGALGLARLLQTLFHGVDPLDIEVYGGVALLLALVALVASVLPARRASSVDPAVSLRAE